MEAKGVSIVIPVCNLLGFTRLCIDYIRRNTAMPYQLVIVDNGSTDGTAEYFKELSKELDVNYLRNEKNLGSIIAINQGIVASKYEYICQMHNDVVVFEKGWPKETMIHELGKVKEHINNTPSIAHTPNQRLKPGGIR